MRPKRSKRRAKRETLLGPERKILSRCETSAELECGHTIINPPPATTLPGPKYYRCSQCPI